MPRKKKPPQPQTFVQYVGFGSRMMRQRALEAGCKTVAEMVDWVDEHYGDRPEREQNYFRATSGPRLKS
jgi:hypothetical protein